MSISNELSDTSASTSDRDRPTTNHASGRPGDRTCAGPGCVADYGETPVKGSYCSSTCHDRHRGRKALNTLKHDHRYCSTCWRVRKEIDQPPESYLATKTALISQTLVGFEDLTQNVSVDGGLIYCKCGAIDHDAEDPTLRGLELQAAIVNVYGLLKTAEREGQLKKRPNYEVFLDELRESDFDWPLAVGRALYGTSSESHRE